MLLRGTLALLPGLLLAQAQPVDLPLQVTNPVANISAKGVVTAELRNNSTRVITAYSVSWTVDNFTTVTAQDFFPSLGFEDFVKRAASQGLADTGKIGVDAIPPGGTIMARNTLAKYAEQQAFVQVVAVIYADASALGDEAEIQKLFQRRLEWTNSLKRAVEAITPLDRANAGEFFAHVSALPLADTDEAVDWIHQLSVLQSRGDLSAQYKISPEEFWKLLQSRYIAARAHSARKAL